MLLALAVFLLHPQLARTTPMTGEYAANDAPAAISASAVAEDDDNSLPVSSGSLVAATQPAAESATALPEVPLPAPSAVTSPAPVAFLKSGKPMTVSVAQLQAENRRKQFMWKGLVMASSGAATFDAISTRYAITKYGAQELNPLLKPFAGNASLFAAIQVAPVLLDYAGKKMMYSRNSWVRRAWWIPQSASFVSSIFCGAHNLRYH